jgi:HD superfamily phosphodiesterase
MTAAKRLQKYLSIDRIKKLHDAVKTAFESRGPFAHNWDHTYRDMINAIWIGEVEGADMNIVIPAILLHDIGFLYDPDPYSHHVIGCEKSHAWLSDWSAAESEKIALCIKSHKGRFPGFEIEPKTLEAQVVHDADLLEKLGKIGILQGLRSFVEFGESGLEKYKAYKALHAIVQKQAALKNVTFYTNTGKELAAQRGGIHDRWTFYNEALAELATYEE